MKKGNAIRNDVGSTHHGKRYIKNHDIGTEDTKKNISSVLYSKSEEKRQNVRTEITQNQVKQRRILICSLQQPRSHVIRQTMILYQLEIHQGRRQIRQKDVKRNDIFFAWDHLWFCH